MMAINAPKWGEWGIAQLEICPDTAKVHIQGMCRFEKNMRLKGLKTTVHPDAHWEVTQDFEASIAYCSKQETRMPMTEPHEWPSRAARPNNKQGKRSDLDAAVATLRSAEGGTYDKLKAVAEAHGSAFCKFFKGMEALAQYTAVPVAVEMPVYYTWQAELDAYLTSNVGHSRWIFWIYDEIGGAGKSTFVRSYIQDPTKKAVALTGKLVDMAYTYQSERVVFFDITRTQTDQMDHLYTFAESLKNGYVHSTKYTPVKKFFKPPHVVFFANTRPAEKKWSADRVRLHELTDGQSSTFTAGFFSAPSGSLPGAAAPGSTSGGAAAPPAPAVPDWGGAAATFDLANPFDALDIPFMEVIDLTGE
jgi:hypothetical protein